MSNATNDNDVDVDMNDEMMLSVKKQCTRLLVGVKQVCEYGELFVGHISVYSSHRDIGGGGRV